ncbi:MAG: Lrp/AsnC family transcriptional regulator [Pseudomonadota bacterium]|nr:Lrp/AsnC family transcriptional regulator [Pseudomonadota bacterium]MEE3101211.1 Lrp/AsnC family transcriptional regulator [Pseudomonadota bacterium]
MTFDRIDLNILDQLQRDATTPVARIAERAGLSQTPCWKRIRRHLASGVIRARVALLDPAPFGLGLTAFVVVETADGGAETRAALLTALRGLPAARDVWRLAGGQDHMLRVVVADMPAFDRFCEALTAAAPVRALRAFFATEQVQASTALPIGPSAEALPLR